MRLEFTVPVRTHSALNARVYWRTRANRAKSERLKTAWAWVALKAHERCAVLAAHLDGHMLVTLTRIAPCALDDDAIPGACKAVRDSLAEKLGLANDRDPSVSWVYGQRRGGVREYAVAVSIESAPTTCPTCGTRLACATPEGA